MREPSPAGPVRLIAGQSLRLAARERSVLLIVVLFVALVLLSAWLGWRATATVDTIYADAATFLAGQGRPVPPNPVLSVSPLGLMRNVSVYVSLIGALAAIVVGNRLVALDRRSGVLPLLRTRPARAWAYAWGKVAALAVLVLGLTGVAALVAVLTLLALPAVQVTGAQWGQLAGFFALSGLYMMSFGCLGLAAAARSRSETVGLLLPVTAWLLVTFVLPSLTANIHPTASINPVSALAAAPDSAFFHWTGWLLGPLSLAESYRYASAALLDFLPEGRAALSALPPVPALILGLIAAGALALGATARIDMTRGDYDV